MLEIIRSAWMGIKTAFMIGKTIGQEGKNKDFIKNPIKTINEVKTDGSRSDSDDKNR